MADITTLKVNKDLSVDLLIVAKLTGQSKEQLTNKILKEGLRPYLDNIKKQRFS